MLQAIFKGITDLGNIRTNNEDAFYVSTIGNGSLILAVAIDGVGGYEGGEVAAQIARDSIIDYCNSVENPSIKAAVVDANNQIYNACKQTAELKNMSCVLTAVLIDLNQRKFSMGHVGDTRLYQWHEGSFNKLSHDHSLIGYREEIGELTEIEAMRHPNRNLISKTLGNELVTIEDDFVEYSEFPIIPGAQLLLCSDGLTDMITSAEIINTLNNQSLTVSQKAQTLIDQAKSAGGKDNVTVVIVELTEDEINETVIEDISQLDDNVEIEPDHAAHDSINSIDKIIFTVVAILLLMAIAMFVDIHCLTE